MKQERRVIIIAGANGAGKTTFAREFLPLDAACPIFVNTDLIAAGLAPFGAEAALERAGNVMRQELQRHFAACESFAFETTLADDSHLTSIEGWRAAGYRVKVIFLQLDCVELAIARVAHRTFPAKPTVPEATIRQEFMAGIENFENLYAPHVDAWALYDNTGIQPILLDWHERARGKGLIEHANDRDLRTSYRAIRRAARRVQEMAELTETPIIVGRNGVLELISSGFEDETVSIHEPLSRYK